VLIMARPLAGRVVMCGHGRSRVPRGGGGCRRRRSHRGLPGRIAQPEGPHEAGRPRREGHLHRTARRDDVALLHIGAVLTPADRLAPEVLLVVQVRVEREKDRIVGRHVPVGAVVEQAAALHEPKVSDVVRRAVHARDHERGLAIGGKRDVLRQDRVEDDVLAAVRLAEDPEMARDALGQCEAGLLVEEDRQADGRGRKGVR
jgi:hypothetical protein